MLLKQRYQQKGYVITLLFFWLQSIELAKERVKARVEEGGHNIEAAIIERRYKRGINNLFQIYLPIVDEAFLFDNSGGRPEFLSHKSKNGNWSFFNKTKFEKLKSGNDDKHE